MGGEPKYVDATKVVKDMEPPNGNFILAKTGGEVEKAEEVAEPKAEVPKKEEKEKKEKPKKEKAGLSPDETKELEKLKNDLIARKTQLKAEGLSGGQQNKDPQVVEWVTRMNELKEKQEPGSTAKKKDDSPKKKKGKLSAEDQKEFDGLKEKIEAYKQQCATEFGMTKKEIKADPDLQDMEQQLVEFEKRAK